MRSVRCCSAPTWARRPAEDIHLVLCRQTTKKETTMTLNRRQFTHAAAALAAGSAAPLAFAADTLKIGYVSPQTGPLAPFGEADKWVIDQMKTAFKDGI